MKQFIFSLALALSIQAQAEITELKSYKDLDLESLKGAVVVFDIDNTLLRQDQMIGTHQWNDDMIERAVERGVDKAVATDAQQRIFNEVQQKVKVVPVEEEIRKVLAYLKANNIPHFALTARRNYMMPITLKQLGILNHDFAQSFPKQIEPLRLNGYLNNGVIFSGNTPKGELLKLIVENSVHKPTKIVFVDDKRYNLESVEKSLTGSGINIESRRYGAADAFVEGYDRNIADLEYSFFVESNELISDVFAHQLSGDYLAITEERFAQDLEDWGPSVSNPQECVEVVAKQKYRCSYFVDTSYDDAMATSVEYDFVTDAKTRSISFGNW